VMQITRRAADARVRMAGEASRAARSSPRTRTANAEDRGMGRVLVIIQGACLGTLCSLAISAPHSSAADSLVPVETAAVMAPLSIDDAAEMQQFEALLDEAAALGVNAVTVDVWWGKVEAAGDQQFDWSYYDTVFEKIEDSGLEIVPIMSFHKCGGGPGDDCNIPLPTWVWTQFQNVGLGPDDLKYESEVGQTLDDAVPAVIQQFVELMNAFEQHFAIRAPAFVELNISLGPTGELRYPAYNSDDGWSFPDRGNFQAYNALATSELPRLGVRKFRGSERGFEPMGHSPGQPSRHSPSGWTSVARHPSGTVVCRSKGLRG
jgi:Glycosyl hydrolase family 14